MQVAFGVPVWCVIRVSTNADKKGYKAAKKNYSPKRKFNFYLRQYPLFYGYPVK